MNKAMVCRSRSYDIDDVQLNRVYKKALRKVSSQMYIEKPFFDYDYLEEQQRMYNELKPLFEERTRNFVLTGFKAVKV